MVTEKPPLEFVRAMPTRGPSGGIRASTSYVFRVAGRQVVVEVYFSSVQTRDGLMGQERVRIAAETFLALEAERFGWNRLADQLVLNEAAMTVVANRLGWNPRFGRQV